jgi:hypothetical protein
MFLICYYKSIDPATKAADIELGAEFALLRIVEPILDNDKLVREVKVTARQLVMLFLKDS